MGKQTKYFYVPGILSMLEGNIFSFCMENMQTCVRSAQFASLICNIVTYNRSQSQQEKSDTGYNRTVGLLGKCKDSGSLEHMRHITKEHFIARYNQSVTILQHQSHI